MRKFLLITPFLIAPPVWSQDCKQFRMPDGRITVDCQGVLNGTKPDPPPRRASTPIYIPQEPSVPLGPPPSHDTKGKPVPILRIQK